MHRTAVFLLTFITGCSTAPVADFMDWVKPGKLPAGAASGGVCGPDCGCQSHPGPPVTSFTPLTAVPETLAPLKLTSATVTDVPVSSAVEAPGGIVVKSPAVSSWRRP